MNFENDMRQQQYVVLGGNQFGSVDGLSVVSMQNNPIRHPESSQLLNLTNQYITFSLKY